MSLGSGGLGTVYSRLPQATSDIESSEDEVSQHENLIYYRKFGTPKKTAVEKEESGPCTMGDYQPLGHERGSSDNRDVHINGFNNINYNYAHSNIGTLNAPEDEMMILGTVGPSGKMEGEVRHGNLQVLVGHEHPMSVMRRVAFVMSICLCIFTIVAFLWVLPCDWATCPMMQDQKHGGTSWEKTLYRLELIGGINVVPSGNKHHNNLLFMVRGEISFPTAPVQGESPIMSSKQQQQPLTEDKAGSTSIPAGGGGIITLMGSTGKMVWYKTLAQVPRDMNCSIVDLDGDGVKDCLLVGVDDMLYAFKPVTPTNLWYLHSSPSNLTKYQVPVDMEFPLVLPDLDGDNISDLLVTCSLAVKTSSPLNTASSTEVPLRSNHNYLLVISGKIGSVLGRAYAVPKCQNVYDLAMDKNWVITFTCQSREGKESVETMPLDKLYELVVNRTGFTPLNLQHLKYPNGEISVKQHTTPSAMKLSPSTGAGTVLPHGKLTWYSVGGRKLTVENHGVCPKDCAVYVRVSDERAQGSNVTLWSDGGENMYVLQPATMSFSERPLGRSTSTMLGPVTGFVLKYWHWTSSSSSEQSSNWSSLQHRSRQPRTWQQIDLSGREENTEAPTSHQAVKRTVSNITENNNMGSAVKGANNSYTAHWLKERIVLVTFNETDMLHLVNASQSEILQLCTEAGCQPSLTFQEQSLIIADLDEDGSQELVSYLTTYATEDPDKTSPGRLQLVSKIRVVRLEAELPKLYEAVIHS